MCRSRKLLKFVCEKNTFLRYSRLKLHSGRALSHQEMSYSVVNPFDMGIFWTMSAGINALKQPNVRCGIGSGVILPRQLAYTHCTAYKKVTAEEKPREKQEQPEKCKERAKKKKEKKREANDSKHGPLFYYLIKARREQARGRRWPY